MIDEEESKRLRIYNREKRLELQLIIERCNEVDFEYVCLPNVRNESDLCFGSRHPRKLVLTCGKDVDSFMRRCLNELHPESKFTQYPEPYKRPTTGHETKDMNEVKLTFPFSSKVPRFPSDIIDSTGVYRQKKRARKVEESKPKPKSSFGSTLPRSCLITRDKLNAEFPGPGVYNPSKPPENFYQSNFGGRRILRQAYEVVCAPKANESKCDLCEELPRNVYWRNVKNQSILCRGCYKTKLAQLQKTRGVVDRIRKLSAFFSGYKKFRSCDFYHDHQDSKAAIRLLSPKTLKRRLNEENLLCTKIMY